MKFDFKTSSNIPEEDLKTSSNIQEDLTVTQLYNHIIVTLMRVLTVLFTCNDGISRLSHLPPVQYHHILTMDK